MILLFDIGNSRVKWAFWDGDNIIDSQALPHQDFDVDDLALGDCRQAWLASVGPKKVGKRIAKQLAKKGVELKRIKTRKQACGIDNCYDNYRQLGVDRWLAMIGARQLLAGNIIVIDAGTAVTVDMLSADNQFKGGVILPGPLLMHDSLVDETAKIEPQGALAKASIIGRNTSDCVNAGVRFGLLGAVDYLCQQLQLQYDDCHIVITGGGAELFTNLSLSKQFCPELVLLGLLAIISERGIERELDET